MIVPSRPLVPAPLFQRAAGNSDTYLRGMEFYPLGRHALLAALCRLGLAAGDTVVFPAYYCESTLGVLRDYGFRLAYVDIGKDLQPDADDLAALCDEQTVGAMVVAHFFGFKISLSPRLTELCGQHGVRVIEDYSHSFLSFDPLVPISGATSAFIFSMRKTLPVPDGGALLIPGADDEIGNPESATGILGSLPFLAVRSVEALCIRLGWPNLYGRRVDGLKRRAARPLGDSSEAMGVPRPGGPGYLLHRLLGNHNLLRRIAEKRRRNYRHLRAGLCGIEELEFLYPDTADGVPLVLPLLSPAKGLLGYLREHGIGAFPWPGEDMPLEIRKRSEAFPNAADINERLVCLPVHQDISDAHITYMTDAVGRFFAQAGLRP